MCIRDSYYTVNRDEWFLIWGLTRYFCIPFHLTTVFNYDSDCEHCCWWLWQLTRYEHNGKVFVPVLHVNCAMRTRIPKVDTETKKENLQIHSKLGISSPTHASQEYDRQLHIRRWWGLYEVKGIRKKVQLLEIKNHVDYENCRTRSNVNQQKFLGSKTS